MNKEIKIEEGVGVQIFLEVFDSEDEIDFVESLIEENYE